MVDDITGFNEGKHIAALTAKNDICQREWFKDIGKSFFASFGAFGNALELAEIMTVKGYY
ncbi:hypothetical protein ASZ90_006367 [hydrocarbon metagenome]|uniref:Uncharacterized protein n=1 Tax=hydrocarbon metagenome TaxID=938273 RepID=A0A0W8FSE6_9ZZZZ